MDKKTVSSAAWPPSPPLLNSSSITICKIAKKRTAFRIIGVRFFVRENKKHLQGCPTDALFVSENY